MRVVHSTEIPGLPFAATGKVAIIQGDRDILGLPLDPGELETWLRVEPHRVVGLVVEGDLAARFSITSFAPQGPFLWVRGSLKAPDIALADAPMRVDGELSVRGLTGPVEVMGNLRCELVVAEPHPVIVHGALAARVALGSVETDRSLAVVGWWDRLHKLHPSLITEGQLDHRALLTAMSKGEALLA